jgi:hypothetical protein
MLLSKTIKRVDLVHSEGYRARMLLSKSKDLLARSQDNVSDYNDMSTSTVVSMSRHYTNPSNHIGLIQSVSDYNDMSTSTVVSMSRHYTNPSNHIGLIQSEGKR